MSVSAFPGDLNLKSESLLATAKAVLQRPDLAEDVRSITIGFGPYPEGPPDTSQIKDDDWASFKAAIDDVCESDDESERWLADAKAGVWDSIVALILPALPNLHEIIIPEMSYDGMEKAPYLQRMLERAAARDSYSSQNPCAFKTLRSVNATY